MRLLDEKSVKGFTLIELLVSMGIGMVIIAAVTNTFIMQSRFYNAQEQVNEMQQNARAAIDMMSREIKMAGYDLKGTAITGSNGIPYNASELRLLADVNGNGTLTDGILPETDEVVIYTWDSANHRIERTSGGNTTIFAENISDFTFDYLDANGNSTPDTSLIRQIRISIIAQTSKPDPNFTANGGHRTYQLTALITPKNLCYKGGSCP